MVRPLTAQSEPPLVPEASGGQRNRGQLFELNAGTQNRVASWAPDQGGASSARAAAAVAVDAAGDTLAEMTGDERRAILAEALDGMTTMERAETGDPELMDEVLDSIANMSKGPAAEGFVKPRVVIASHGDPLELADSDDPAGPKHVLDDDVLGAYVPPDADGNPPGGTILLSNTLSSTPAEGELSLEDVALEELGEAVAEYAFSQGIRAADGPRSVVNDEGETVAAGDAGARILVARDGEALTDDHFVADPENDLTTVLLGNNLEENVAAAEIKSFDPTQEDELTEAQARGYLDSMGLTEDTFATWDAPMVGTQLQQYIAHQNLDSESGIRQPSDDQIVSLARLLRPAQDVSFADVSFSYADMIQLVRSGALQFTGNGPVDVQGVYIDLSTVDHVLPQNEADDGTAAVSIGEAMLKGFGGADGNMNQHQLDEAFQAYFGFGLAADSVDGAEPTRLAHAFHAFAGERGVVLDGDWSKTWNEAELGLLDAFIWETSSLSTDEAGAQFDENSIFINRDNIFQSDDYTFTVGVDQPDSGDVTAQATNLSTSMAIAFDNAREMQIPENYHGEFADTAGDYANQVTFNINSGTQFLVNMMTALVDVNEQKATLHNEVEALYGHLGQDEVDLQIEAAEREFVTPFIESLGTWYSPDQIEGITTLEDVIELLDSEIALGIDEQTKYVRAAIPELSRLSALDELDRAGWEDALDIAQSVLYVASSAAFIAGSGGIALAGSALYGAASVIETAQQGATYPDDVTPGGLTEYVEKELGADLQTEINRDPDKATSQSIYQFSRGVQMFERGIMDEVDDATENMGEVVLSNHGDEIAVEIEFSESEGEGYQSEEYYDPIFNQMKAAADDMNSRRTQADIDAGVLYFVGFSSSANGAGKSSTFDEGTTLSLRVLNPMVAEAGFELSENLGVYTDNIDGERDWWETPQEVIDGSGW